MTCEEYRKLFSNFIDGELKDLQIEDFRNHLNNCKACKEEFERFRQAQTLLKLLPKKEAPPELWGMIETRVRLGEGKLVSFFPLEGIFDRFVLEEVPSPPVPIYGISFGMPRWGQSAFSVNR